MRMSCPSRSILSILFSGFVRISAWHLSGSAPRREPDQAPHQATRRAPGRLAVLRRLLGFLAPFWPLVALSVLLGVGTVAAGAGLLGASAWIIASAALHPSIAVLQVAIVGVRFFGIARGVLRYLERLTTHDVTFRLLARLRVWFYERLEPLAPAGLAQYRSGDLLARAVADIGTLEDFYVRAVSPPLVALAFTGGMTWFVGRYDGRVAAALFIGLATAGLGVPVLVRALAAEAGRREVALRAELSAGLVDGVQGLADSLAFGGEAVQMGLVQRLGRDLAAAQTSLAAVRGLYAGLHVLLAGLTVLATLVLATPLVRSGQLTGVDLAVLALLAGAAFEAVQPLPAASQHLDACLAAGARLFEVADAAPPANENVGAALVAALDQGAPPRGNVGAALVAALHEDAPLPGQGGHKAHPYAGAKTSIPAQSAPALEFSDLSMRYAAGEPPALDGVSFALPVGGRLAVVGPSGAGKTSLVNVLLRFWEYQAGEARLFGRDLRSYTTEDVAARVAVVSQDTYLFNTTLRENLLLARPTAGQADLDAATAAAGLSGWIAGLPDGYETWIGEQGRRLSGGERQRIAIARALLKDAPLLVLDEATANLDPLTEAAVLAALDGLMRGRATLMITHRPAGLRLMDEVLVLDGGRVAQHGRPAALLKQPGLYRMLWEQQMQQDAVERASGR